MLRWYDVRALSADFQRAHATSPSCFLKLPPKVHIDAAAAFHCNREGAPEHLVADALSQSHSFRPHDTPELLKNKVRWGQTTRKVSHLQSNSFMAAAEKNEWVLNIQQSKWFTF